MWRLDKNKKMKKTIFGLFILVLISSCNSEPTNENPEHDIVELSSFVKTFEGSIDGKYDLVMKLVVNNGYIDGKYWNMAQKINLEKK